jgi:Zn-dependent protease with chaperone function
MHVNEPVSGKYFDGTSARQNLVLVHADTRHGSPVLVIQPESGPEILWPTSDLREVTDQARDQGIVLCLGQEGIARLIIPHGHAEDVVRAMAPNLGKVVVHKSKIKQIILWGGGAIASVALIMFVILPAMSDQLATMIPREREAALGRVAIGQISTFLGSTEEEIACTNPAGQKALKKMTTRMVGNTDIPYDLQVKVFNHDMINAFAVPGGHVVLFKGLLDAARSPEEVAGVLGHEVGHVVNRDPTRLMLRSAGSVGILGMVFGDFAGGFLALVLAEQLISAQYAQGAEANADTFTHGLMADAQLPAKSFATFFDTLKNKYGDDQGLLSHLASHPDLEGRANAAYAADVIGDGPFDPVLTAKEWSDLKNICS